MTSPSPPPPPSLSPLKRLLLALSYALSALYTQLFTTWDLINPLNTPHRSFDPAKHLRGEHLRGKVVLLTGGHSGCGYETVRWMLKVGGAERIYMLGRSIPAMQSSMRTLCAELFPSSGSGSGSGSGSADSPSPSPADVPLPATLHFIQCDLADLHSVKAAAGDFFRLERERVRGRQHEDASGGEDAPRIDVFFANAGVFSHDLDERTKQGLEMNWGVNCVGHYVLLHYLSPTLHAAASRVRRPDSELDFDSNEAARGFSAASPRVIWTGSIATDWMLCGPGAYFGSFAGGIPALALEGGAGHAAATAPNEDITQRLTMPLASYSRSKLGNFLAMRYSLGGLLDARPGADGGAHADGEKHGSPPAPARIFSCVVHPGVLQTPIQRHWQSTWPWELDQWIFRRLASSQQLGCINLLWSAFIVGPSPAAEQRGAVSMEELHGGFGTQWCKVGRVSKLARDEELARRHGEFLDRVTALLGPLEA